MAVKEKQGESSEEFEWNFDNEVQLFLAMNGHKPVGINKYFHMVCIWEKFRAAINKDVSLKAIWDKLKTLYDIMALDEMEDVPFPSNETDFSLPESEFAELMKNHKLSIKDETESKSKESKDKVKEIKKEKEVKDIVKKEIVLRDSKVVKEVERKKEEVKKVVKESETKKENKQRESKETKKDQKVTKGRHKLKEEAEDTGPPVKKERKDSESSRESSRESSKRALKRPTRQSTDSSSKTSSPRDTPPLKRRRT